MALVKDYYINQYIHCSAQNLKGFIANITLVNCSMLLFVINSLYL